MNRIEHYEFGEIVVDGNKYRRDLIIFPDKVIENWWRKEGHRLSIEDLQVILEYKPEILIIGTGYYGYMKVPREVEQFLIKNNISVHILETKKACNLFNELLKQGKRVAAALHLTC